MTTTPQAARPALRDREDTWCQNCAQMIRPKRSFGLGVYLATFLAFCITNLALTLLVGLSLTGFLWLAAALTGAAATWLWLAPRDVRWSCPICKTLDVPAPPTQAQ